MHIGQVWYPKYHYHLDFTNAVPIWAKPPCLYPKEEAWLDVHLNELVTNGMFGPIFSGDQPQCVTPLFLVLGT